MFLWVLLLPWVPPSQFQTHLQAARGTVRVTLGTWDGPGAHVVLTSSQALLKRRARGAAPMADEIRAAPFTTCPMPSPEPSEPWKVVVSISQAWAAPREAGPEQGCTLGLPSSPTVRAWVGGEYKVGSRGPSGGV